MHDRERQGGFSLMETLIAISLVMVAVMAATVYVSTATHGTKHNKDKDFAVQKAISILEELKAVGESVGGQSASVLDDWDDGGTTDPLLTIDTVVTDPAHPSSGNYMDGSGWKFERQISIQKFASLQSKDVRLVNVKVLGRQGGQLRLMAEVSSVIRTIADNYPPSQVYDVYCLAVENVPGWWVYMANLVPFVERAIQDLQSRNPGLEFRTHWIRTGAYGRDAQYTPYLNRSTDSTADIDSVYFYPGTMPSGSAVNTYYVPESIRGRINVDGTLRNGYDVTTNPFPYALADQYNHAMRYPDELALFNNRMIAGQETADVPTLRILLEDMYSNPDKYENALVINVHGELFPFPPIRNYSDPAKEPLVHPGVRVVGHPEQLRYDNSEDVALRVYTYLSDPTDVSAPDRLGAPVSVLIRGLSSAPGLTVRSIEGGLDLNPVDSNNDMYIAELNDTSSDYTGDMHYDVQTVAAGVLVRLYNSPLRTPCSAVGCAAGGGLATGKRLYGLEYIPTPIPLGASGPFSRDLTTPGDRTKNTARWRIRIPAADLPSNAVLSFEVRIDDDLTTGVLYPTANEPTNLSKTYVWRGTDLWVFGDGTPANPPNLPLTERFQFLGDPRHNPYADVKADYSAGNRLGMGYNRYFDDFHNTADGNLANDSDYWTGFSGVKNDSDPDNDGWFADQDLLEIDINRAFQVLRSSLLRSQTVYTTMTGWSYYYIGIGNEIGYDSANNFPNSIPVSDKAYSGSSGTRQEQSITDATISGILGGVKYVKENRVSNYWWSMHWLGELYPDASYATWAATGNLPTGVGTGTFVRVRRDQINENLPAGTRFLNATRRTKRPGCTTFFSTGTTSSKFHHQGDGSGQGSIVSQGNDIASRYHFTIPQTVSINRPFNWNLNGSGPVPQDFQDPAYDVAGLSTSTMATYYDHTRSGLVGSAALELDGAGADVAYIAVNGISNTALTGSAFMGRWAFLTLIQSFLEAGLTSNASRIEQLPRVEITQPDDVTELVNPSSIAMQWAKTWRRWDGLTYTSGYSTSFAESSPISYAVLYSDDGGASWKYAQDNSQARPGARHASSYLMTGTSYTLPTPASDFPQASYLLRVEGFRDDIELHYAYHQRKVFIKR